MSETSFDFFVDPKTIKDATTNNWTPPEHAAIRSEPGHRDYRASWYEEIQVSEASKQGMDDGTIIFTAVVAVPGDSQEVSSNIGRKHWQKFWIKMEDGKIAKDDSTARNFKNLMDFCKAAGLDLAAGFNSTAWTTEKLSGARMKARYSIYVDKNENEQASMDRFKKVID